MHINVFHTTIRLQEKVKVQDIPTLEAMIEKKDEFKTIEEIENYLAFLFLAVQTSIMTM
ncbi:hypothetical protein SH601_03860 [Gracilibacillus sp. S3-1-1]|uniref:Uncharacterized protein n=1 Tax=Gracilibacillus pellucidus TaxID=3095368 RepID=A0ACC6M2D3_9BACI|nr:hypothetical protein [Gracilibacillus sp. S3-1-1]MDX8045114.1 hypothetical protein [Gracilibacillus sp. S3-1-1]